MDAAFMLKASSNILSQVNDELLNKGYTPLQLASELGLAVQLVENFLNGEIVDRSTYNLICEKLNIFENISVNSFSETLPENKDLVDITIPKDHKSTSRNEHSSINNDSVNVLYPDNNLVLTNHNQTLINSLSTSPNSRIDIDKLLQAIRQNISVTLIRQCDRLKVIDINTPFCLHDLYTEPSLFTDLPSSQYLDLNEAFANVSPEQYDRFYLAKLQPPKIPANQALDTYKQVLLVGNLGSGKTTLLKYWAMTCITDKISPNYLPVFLPLRSLVSFDHLRSENDSLNNPYTWIKSQINNYIFAEPSINELFDNKIFEQLLNEGRFLLLWDGLDEIPEIHSAKVAQQILHFSDRYPKNCIVVATRNPKYAHILESFQTLELAPFQETQIKAFASKWFTTTCLENPKKHENFQQLIATNQPLAEIASNPLFLTYLCTIFNSCEYLKPNFYQEILNLLLTTWEQTKCLPSFDNQSLSISQKQDLLSYLAIVSLDRHGYVWQNNELENDLQSCLSNSRRLSHITFDRDQFLQSLKWQHSLLIECAKDVYCLAHTTLHDYLAAYRIANSNALEAEKYLLERMYFHRWHGVIVMTISISQKADRILQKMKKKIDELVTKDPQLLAFLTWVNQQSIQIKTPYKAVTIRALYLDIDLENTRSLDRARALDMAHSRSLERAKMRSMGIENSMETEVDIDYTINLALNLDLALHFANHHVLELACIIEPDLQKGLQYLRQKFPDPYKDRDKFAKWWQAKGLDWSKKLRGLIVQHRKSSQEWRFSENQLKVLRTYHDANKLLIECLNNAEYVTPLVKSQIESTLLLPQGEYNTILQY